MLTPASASRILLEPHQLMPKSIDTAAVHGCQTTNQQLPQKCASANLASETPLASSPQRASQSETTRQPTGSHERDLPP